MNTSDAVIQADANHVWHPCPQMRENDVFTPLMVEGAEGAHLMLKDGRKIIDGIASWWCKSLGHQHPRLKQALLEQMGRLEHAIFANTTNPTVVELSRELCNLLPHLGKVFYAGDGACANEIAMKISLHTRMIRGETKRTTFITLENGYHGETAGALSVSDMGCYRAPYEAMLFQPHLITDLPYVTGQNDPLWHECSAEWQRIETQLASFTDTATAIIFEPLVQGAGGLKIYSMDFLRRLAAWARAHQIHLIADEIMTGIGRTGKMLACEHAEIAPDFVCLSKGLTSGWMPLSVTITTNEIYDTFYENYHPKKAFLHSHTYSGNPLSAAIALETLQIMCEEALCNHAVTMGDILRSEMQRIADQTGVLSNVRSLGAIAAAEVMLDTPYLGLSIHERALQLGALIRPIRNTVYWLPPLNVDEATLLQLSQITHQVLSDLKFK